MRKGMQVRVLTVFMVLLVILSGCSTRFKSSKDPEDTGGPVKITHNGNLKKQTLIIWGTDLPKEERDELKKHFKGEKIAEYDITQDDYEEFFGSRPSNGSLLSSVAVRYNKSGGVKAQILTPENITEIKEHQYINAAITAGLLDADMRVVSTRKVTGESALAGVFKAYKLMGFEADKEKLKSAQEEMSKVAEIGVDLNEEELKKLSEVILSIKEKISTEKTGGEGTNTVEEVNNSLQDNNIVLSDENKEKLNGVLKKFEENLTKEDAEKLLKRAESFGKSILESGSDLVNKANESGFFSKIINWIKGIFN